MKKTNTILDQIIVDKQAEVVRLVRDKSLTELRQELATKTSHPELDFFEALKTATPQRKIIAEVKKASPSAGTLRSKLSLEAVNEAYQASDNIVAISVITESTHFDGSPESLRYFAMHNRGNKPLLRKDFIFDEYQIVESKLLGAHAYLLIASLFEKAQLQALIDCGRELGLEPLVEVHSEDELDMVQQTTARCIGVNARDLKDFSINVGLHRLLEKLDDSYARVAESGIETGEQMKRVMTYADAALVGSHFMKATNIKAAIDELAASGVQA
jgi:indole-3-glycerol phosphate synthase